MSRIKDQSKVSGTKGFSRKFLPRFSWVAMTLLGALVLSGKPLRASPASDSLEVRIWTSDLSDFTDLEKASVRLLQDRPGAYEHYLIAELSFRMFRANPAELRFLKQASEMSQQAIELAPNQEFGYVVAAQVLDLMGYKDEAAAMLNEQPESARGWRTDFVKGVLAQSDEKGGMVDFASSLRDKTSSKDLIGTFVASSLESSYSGSDLVRELVEWRKVLDTIPIQSSLARAYAEAGRSAESHQLYTEILKKHPSPEIKFADAIVLYSRLGKSRTKEAEKLFHEIAATSKDTELVAAAQAHLARISLQKGDLKNASQLIHRVLLSSTERLKWIAFTHKSYADAGRLQDFSVLLDELRQELPGTGFLYALQGEVLSESLSQHAKAIEAFAAAITLEPKRSEFYNGMGLAYYRMNRHEEALVTFDKALKIDPKDATARYNEACVLSLMGRSDEAVGSLKQAISLDGRLQDVALSDKDFTGLRSNTDFQALVKEKKVTKVP